MSDAATLREMLAEWAAYLTDGERWDVDTRRSEMVDGVVAWLDERGATGDGPWRTLPPVGAPLQAADLLAAIEALARPAAIETTSMADLNELAALLVKLADYVKVLAGDVKQRRRAAVADGPVVVGDQMYRLASAGGSWKFDHRRIAAKLVGMSRSDPITGEVLDSDARASRLAQLFREVYLSDSSKAKSTVLKQLGIPAKEVADWVEDAAEVTSSTVIPTEKGVWGRIDEG